MNIVLDTNILFRNWYLKGPHFIVLERHIKLGQSVLVIPEIVVLEIKNLYKEELIKYISKVSELDNMAPALRLSSNIPNIKMLCSEYEKTLQSRLNELGVKVISHSDIPHNVIVPRALSKRKPFSKSGKGYRDTLIWEIVLTKVANKNSATFLITDNYKDFGNKKSGGELHPDLIEDLGKKKLGAESVRWYRSLKEFLDHQIVPHLKKVTSEILGELKKGQYKSFSIEDWFIKYKESFLQPLNEWIGNILYSTPQFETPEVSYIEDPERISVEDAYTLDDDRIYLDATALAEVIIDGFIYKSDYYGLSEEHDISIMNEDWNEHYMWAKMTLLLPISFSLIFNMLEIKVEEFEVNPVQEIFGWCKECGAPILSDAAEECRECGKRFF